MASLLGPGEAGTWTRATMLPDAEPSRRRTTAAVEAAKWSALMLLL